MELLRETGDLYLHIFARGMLAAPAGFCLWQLTGNIWAGLTFWSFAAFMPSPLLWRNQQ